MNIPIGVCSCIFCGEQLFWQNDVPYEEIGSKKGLLVLLKCKSCDAQAAFVSSPNDDALTHWFENEVEN